MKKIVSLLLLTPLAGSVDVFAANSRWDLFKEKASSVASAIANNAGPLAKASLEAGKGAVGSVIAGAHAAAQSFGPGAALASGAGVTYLIPALKNCTRNLGSGASGAAVDILNTIKSCSMSSAFFVSPIASLAGERVSESIGNPSVREASKKAARLAAYGSLALGAANVAGFALAPYVGIGDWGTWSEGFSMGSMKGYIASYNSLALVLAMAPSALPAMLKVADESVHKAIEVISNAVYSY